MRQMCIVGILAFAVLLTGARQAEASDEDFEGIWYGSMKIAPGFPFRMVIEIFPEVDGELGATLISLDEFGAGSQFDGVTFEEEYLRLELSHSGVVYEGVLAGEGRIEGEYRQAGQTFLLLLERVAEVPGFPRSQVLRRPFPYGEEEVTFENAAAGVTLAGTLTTPQGEGPFPAVVLISGSGSQNRNELMAYHRPFLVLADYLTRRGIAVLRYDDRGFGFSSGDYLAATTEDFADDAQAAVEYLKGRADIDPGRIGMVGHSEGGMIAPIVAARSGDVAFIALLAGPGVSGMEVLELQRAAMLRAGGADEAAVAMILGWYDAIQRVILEEADNAEAERRIREMYAALSDEERGQLGWTDRDLAVVLFQMLTPWYRYFLQYDPIPVLEQVRCPVLAINGDRDLQVPIEENLGGIAAALERGGNGDVTVVELADLNHLFQQTAGVGAPSEYMTIAETMSPTALRLVADWVRQQVGLPPLATAVAELEAGLPATVSLAQNFPNPFNSSTTIEFDLAENSRVELAVYDLLGQQVAVLVDGERGPGRHAVRWDGRDSRGGEAASGIYLYRLRVGERAENRSLLLLR